MKQQFKWKSLIDDLSVAGMTQSDIAQEVGFKSSSTVSELASGQIKKVYWEQGDALIKLHSRTCRRARVLAPKNRVKSNRNAPTVAG